MMHIYDALVIGSGQGGNPLAKKLADHGLKVALIEKRKIGGTCVNDGCTPTKAMIASAKRVALINTSNGLGVEAGEARADMSKIIDRKNEIVDSFRRSSEKQLKEKSNLNVIFGKAAFTGHKEIEVVAPAERFKISAERIFINTGTRPLIPEIPGLDQVDFLTSSTLLDQKQLPNHLLILGGGPVALEFAQMFRRFGSKVTVVEKKGTILSKEDQDISEEITTILENEGIRVLTGTDVERFERRGSTVLVIMRRSKERLEVDCTHVLVAVGRIPNTADLNLATTGVEIDDKGFVKVNDELETTTKGIYALGDVKGGPKFTHVSYNDHVVLVDALLKQQKVSISNRLIPYCVFIDPQLGRVGLTEKQARDKGLDIAVAKLPMKYVARAIETGDTRGMMKAVVDTKTKKILGAAILGSEGGEVMAVLQVAMMGGVTYDRIREGIFAHPTYAESLNNLFMTLNSD